MTGWFQSGKKVNRKWYRARNCRNCFKSYHAGGRQVHCDKCAVGYRQAMSNASGAVSRAVARGDLKNPSDCVCVGCGGKANCYDHRDYTKPLQVQPVCGSCNHKRGAAVWHDKKYTKRRKAMAIVIESDAIECAALTLMVAA